MKKKIIIILSVIVLAIVIVVLCVNNKKTANESKRTIIDDTVIVNGLEIKGPSINFDGGFTNYSSEIKNTKKDLKLKYIEVTLFDSDDKEYKMNVYVGDELKKDETKVMSYTVDQRMDNVKSIKYKIVK